MPLTALDPRSALICVDLQHGILGLPTAHDAQEVADRAGGLAEAFRRSGRPVVLVNVAGTAPGRTDTARTTVGHAQDFTELSPSLGRRPDDLLVTKHRWGAFTGTSLHADLADLGVTQVVLTGISTSVGVESTARSAHELGYHVVLVSDAMTDTDAIAHEHSIRRIFPKLGQVTTASEVMTHLEQR